MNNIFSKKNFYILCWIIILQICGALSSIISNSAQNNWYYTLSKSALTPPGFIFGIVWPILYLTIAISGYCIFCDKKHKIWVKLAYICQLICNWAWSIVFFKLHLTGLSTVLIILIIICIAYILHNVLRTNIIIYYLLLPYFLWLCFALYLNVYAYVHN